MTHVSHPFVTIYSAEFKMVPNYPPHPPIFASRHREQVLRIPADYQLPEYSGSVGN